MDKYVHSAIEQAERYREWARRTGWLDVIHSLDDRYDHDVDELLSR